MESFVSEVFHTDRRLKTKRILNNNDLRLSKDVVARSFCSLASLRIRNASDYITAAAFPSLDFEKLSRELPPRGQLDDRR